MPGFLPPLPIQQLCDNTGKPLAGGLVTSWQAGTATPQPLFTDRGLLWPYPDPFLLDAGGRSPAGEVWMDSALSYKIAVAAGDGTQVQLVDNLTLQPSVPVVSVTTTGGPTSISVPTAPLVSVQLQSASAISIAGFTGGAPGQLLLVRGRAAVGVSQLLLHLDAGTPVGDRLTNYATSGATIINGPGAAIYQRGPAGQGWFLIVHDQGAAITWLPAWTFLGLSVGITYVTRDGQFVLRGQYLTGSFRMGLTAKGTSTGQMIVQGWPYQNQPPGPANVNGCVVTFAAGFTGLTGRLSTTMVPGSAHTWTANAGTMAPVTDVNVTNASDLIAYFRYPVL